MRPVTSVRVGAVRLCGLWTIGRLFVARRSFDVAAFREILANTPVRTAEIPADLQNTKDTERRKAMLQILLKGSTLSAG